MDISSDSDSAEKSVGAISSPIRVTPDRDRGDRKGRRRGDKDRGKKLSVKDRLFVSKKTIGEWMRQDIRGLISVLLV